MDINIKMVPNKEIKKRKAFTGADWWFDIEGNLQVRVATELHDWRMQAALAMHEAAEALICRHMGITVESVDDFDARHMDDEKDPGFNSGDQPDAPYRLPHTYATAIERILTGVLGVDWKEYDEKLSAL